MKTQGDLMNTRYDEKGKFYTNIIAKEDIEAIIQTDQGRIVGTIHIRPEARLKDEINRSEQFFAVTDAIVYDVSGDELYQCSFMTINRDHIVWIIPNEDLSTDGTDQAGGAA